MKFSLHWPRATSMAPTAPKIFSRPTEISVSDAVSTVSNCLAGDPSSPAPPTLALHCRQLESMRQGPACAVADAIGAHWSGQTLAKTQQTDLFDALRRKDAPSCLQEAVDMATSFVRKVAAADRWPVGSHGALVARAALIAIVARDVEPAARAALAEGNLMAMQSAQKALRDLAQVGEISLPPAAAAIARWQPTPQTLPMYEALRREPAWNGEAKRTLRWLIGLQGPEQPLYGTVRASRTSQHQPISLQAQRGGHRSAAEALLANVPAEYSRDILTVAMGQPYRSPSDIWMTFHGRTHRGFQPSARLLLEACDAALWGAWLADGQRLSEHMTALLTRFSDGCAEGKAQEALDALSQRQAVLDEADQVTSLWQQVDQGLKTPTDVMSEHVRVLYAQSWRRYAKDNQFPQPESLTQALVAQMDQDPRFTRHYFNTEILVESLLIGKARVTHLPAKQFNSLIAEQVHIFATIELL